MLPRLPEIFHCLEEEPHGPEVEPRFGEDKMKKLL